LLLCRYDIEWD